MALLAFCWQFANICCAFFSELKINHATFRMNRKIWNFAIISDWLAIWEQIILSYLLCIANIALELKIRFFFQFLSFFFSSQILRIFVGNIYSLHCIILKKFPNHLTFTHTNTANSLTETPPKTSNSNNQNFRWHQTKQVTGNDTFTTKSPYTSINNTKQHIQNNKQNLAYLFQNKANLDEFNEVMIAASEPLVNMLNIF